MRRDGTARIVLASLAVTGVVVSAILAKQATVTRRNAYASAPMLEVSVVDRGKPAIATIGTKTANESSLSHSATSPVAPGSGSSTAPASLTFVTDPFSPSFVGPPEDWVREMLDAGLAPSPALAEQPASENAVQSQASEPDLADATMRWFHGRPVRPKRVLWMRVTAYSPDERSCPGTADGRTATMHCVSTNNWHLVAADPTVLPMGSMLTVPGYGKLESGEEPIVPVLDIGGAIKGERLDVLFPTHEEALKWGVKDLPVVIWEYADGKPFANPRAAR
jgi:3D (Asp-Asp-Asp) domain-containing protein